jgi:hypothetical protein
MASTIKLKNGSGAPLAGDLVQGEPALDLTNKRLYTEDSGGTVIEVGVNPAAEITANAGIALPDGQKATFGASDDLQIYHDGSNSYITDAGTGDLNILASNFGLKSGSGSLSYLTTNSATGAVSLYKGTAKLVTTDTGIDVTGTVTADGLTVDSAIDTSAITISTPYGTAGEQYSALRWNNSSFAGGDSEIRNVVNGAASVGSSLEFHTEHTGTGVLTERLKLHNNGDISFYNTAGTSQSFFWDASAESLGIGTTSPSSGRLHIQPTDGQVSFFSGLSGSTNNPYLQISHSESGGFTKLNAQGSTVAGSNLVFSTINTERMRITSSGNVGIGTTSPNAALDVTGGLNSTHAIFSGQASRGLKLSTANTTSNDDTVVYDAQTSGSGTHVFKTSGTERMRIDSSGNVGIGTSSPANTLEISRAGVASMSLNSTSSSSSELIQRGASTNVARHVFVAGGQTAYVDSFDIQQESGGITRLINRANAPIIFATNDSERMRITSGGNLLVGQSTNETPAANNNVGAAIGANGGISASKTSVHVIELNRTEDDTNNREYVRFYRAGATNLAGTITATKTLVAYNTSSDQRLKDNIVDAPSSSDDIDAIQVRSFDWKADGSHQKYGMIAQELMTVAPEAVSGDPDSDEMMGVDYSKLVPMLIKEIQSLRARVAQLEGAN